MKQTGTLKVMTSGDREIVMIRVFDAPRGLVFDALTKPELLRRWFFGPPGWSLAVCEVDLRVGGTYRYVWRGPDGTEMGMGGVHREVVRPERIVCTQLFDEDWTGGEAVGTLVLTEQEGKTTLTNTVLYSSREARDAVLKTPMEQGMAAGYDRLEELLASGDPEQDLVMTRILDAPVDHVCKAWTEPEFVMRWWGPTGFTSPLARMDVRIGGTSLVCMRAPEEFGGQDMYSTWEYREIDPMRRIEYIHNLADKDGNQLAPALLGMPPDFPQDQRHIVTFESLGDHQTKMTITECGWTAGQMMELSRIGLGQCLDKMAATLATAQD